MKDECAYVFPIYLEFKDEIFHFIRGKVKDEDVASDLSSNLVLKLHQQCEKVSTIKNIKAWLYRVALNTVYDHFREVRKSTHLAEVYEQEVETDEQVKHASERCLMNLMDLLPKEYAEPVLMADVQGISQKKIAEILGLSYSNTKMRVQRGREKLRVLFQECCTLELEE